MLRSDLCDCSDVYIFVKGRIIVEGDNDDETRNKKLMFQNNVPFRSCISINQLYIYKQCRWFWYCYANHSEVYGIII